MNYVNIKTIMDRITRHPLLRDIPLETVIDYTVDFIRIVGMPPIFKDKLAVIPIKEFRGELPCDFYEMTQVRENRKGGPCFRYSTDTFHLSNNKPSYSDPTYKIQGNCIFTYPLEEGEIEIAYQAIAIDEDGYPLIPDKSPFLRALELYIKRQYFTIQFDLGKINPQIMQRTDQEYAWAVGQCQSDLVRPTLDQMQSISNMWNTLIPRFEHKYGFAHLGAQEHLKNH